MPVLRRAHAPAAQDQWVSAGSNLLAGVQYGPGDPVPLEVIPEKSLGALIRTGALIHPSEISDEERVLHTRRREAEIELANVQAILGRIKSDKLKMAQRVEELTRARAAGALAAYQQQGGVK